MSFLFLRITVNFDSVNARYLVAFLPIFHIYTKGRYIGPGSGNIESIFFIVGIGHASAQVEHGMVSSLVAIEHEEGLGRIALELQFLNISEAAYSVFLKAVDVEESTNSCYNELIFCGLHDKSVGTMLAFDIFHHDAVVTHGEGCRIIL